MHARAPWAKLVSGLRRGGPLCLLLLLFAPALVAAQSSKQTDDRIRFFQWRVSRDPDDFSNYNRLAASYLQKARESGDVTYFDLAEKAVQRSLELESTHAQAADGHFQAASVFFGEHRFAEAAREAEKSLACDEEFISAYSIMGDALTEMGEYAKAAEAYAKLQPRRSLTPELHYLQLTRAATLAMAQANPRAAIEPLQLAAAEADAAHLPKENIAWTQYTLADAQFQLGRLDAAEQEVRQSLASFPGYHRALAELARIRAAQGRLPEAAESYKKAIAVIPLPVYAAALGDVLTKLDKRDEAEKNFRLVEFIATLNAKQLYNRELASFYADHGLHLDKALELATRELQVRHDLYTYDTLAWVQLRSGKVNEARQSLARIEGRDVSDSLLLYHWGMIHLATGDAEHGRRFLERAIALNPNFHVRFADDARATLKKQAIAAGARANAS